MSLSEAQEFLRQTADDQELAKAAAAAHRRALVELARERGFDVTEQDLAEAASAVRAAPYGQVDDAALKAVAGGTNATSAVVW